MSTTEIKKEQFTARKLNHMLTFSRIGLARTENGYLSGVLLDCPERPFGKMPVKDIHTTGDMLFILPNEYFENYCTYNFRHANAVSVDIPVTEQELYELHKQHNADCLYRMYHTEQKHTVLMTEEYWNAFRRAVYKLYLNDSANWKLYMEHMKQKTDQFIQETFPQKNKNAVSLETYLKKESRLYQGTYSWFLLHSYKDYRYMKRLLNKTAYAVYMDDTLTTMQKGSFPHE